METTERLHLQTAEPDAHALRTTLAEIVGVTRSWRFMAADGYYSAERLVEVLAEIEDRACQAMPWLRA